MKERQERWNQRPQRTNGPARLSQGLALLSVLLWFSFAHAADVKEKRPIDGIADNSFLIEEAYNQEPGVVQHIFTAQYGAERDKKPRERGWNFSFTQEWPIFSELHQFSYTIPSSHIHGGGESQSGIGDILLNYRLQALDESESLPAFAPRFSLVLPTGSRDEGTGSGVVGYQWNLPVSKKVGSRLAFHANAGLTYLPGARARLDQGLSPKRSLVSYSLGMSGIFALTTRAHLMMEWVGVFEASINDRGRKKRDFISAISPGIRAAVIDEEDLQVVLGLAAPIGLTRPADEYGVFLYVSVEHNFLR
ncbi:MAG: transporter [Deltaproteobacteria bacterium]|nr:transporter [Deltaproteobacteria bacterium]